MRVDLLDYPLPKERIAIRPTADREDARLLLVGSSGALEDRTIRDFPSLVPEGALVVLNDTRVLRARLLGNKESTGGKVELLLVRRLGAHRSGGEQWEALGRGLHPHRHLLRMRFGDALSAELEQGPLEGSGTIIVRLFTEDGSSVERAVEQWGRMPLPPYVRRADDAADAERYQTVFARVPGAVAAPTAGLHLTEGALERLRARGVRVASLTLHVGLGTFQPVSADDLDQHPMHAEVFEVSSALVSAIADARARGAPVVAVGTTVVRALESAARVDREGEVREVSGETRLLIQPGYHFRVVDALLTNFHLPRSTLLALVFAFAGRERVLEAYDAAIRREYRFFSYGDAMWLPGPPVSRRPEAGASAR